MKYTYSIKMSVALWASVGIICFASASAMAWDQNPQQVGFINPTFF